MVGLYLPLLIIVIILIFAGFSGKWLSTKLLRGNRGYIVFVAYLVVLLIGSVIAAIIPASSEFEGKLLSEEEINDQSKLNDQIYQQVQLGKVDEIEGISVKEQWEFPFEGKKLNIDLINTDYGTMLTFVEKVSSLKGKIESSYYLTKYSIENVDITDRVPSPDLKFDESKLSLLPGSVVEISIAKLSRPFPFNQFTDKAPSFFEGMNRGMDFVYIRVPEGTEIEGEVWVIN